MLAPIVLTILSYLLGSVPSGFLVGSSAGVDVRSAGSGNIGATNVARTLGWKKGLLTLFFDVAKGFLPVLAAHLLDLGVAAAAAGGLAAFAGHLYPVFLKFKGGKGVATAAGVYAGVMPLGILVLLGSSPWWCWRAGGCPRLPWPRARPARSPRGRFPIPRKRSGLPWSSGSWW